MPARRLRDSACAGRDSVSPRRIGRAAPGGAAGVPGRASLAVGLVALVAVVAVGAVVLRAGGEPASTAGALPRRRADRASAVPVIPARWSATLRHADYPQFLFHDARDDAIVIGDNWVHEIDIGDGDSHWRAHTERLNGSAALRADTILLSTEAGFVALDRATGAQRWRTDTPETPSAVALVGPAGTPAVAMVSTHEGGLVGLDSRTGTAAVVRPVPRLHRRDAGSRRRLGPGRHGLARARRRPAPADRRVEW